MTCFARIFLLTKNGSFMTVFNEESNGLTRMNLPWLPQNRASWKKKYAVGSAVLQWFYSFRVLHRNKTLNGKFYFHQVKRARENLRKLPAVLDWRNFVIPFDNARSNLARITQDKNWIQAGLFFPIHHLNKILRKWFLPFSFFIKCSECR